MSVFILGVLVGASVAVAALGFVLLHEWKP